MLVRPASAETRRMLTYRCAVWSPHQMGGGKLYYAKVLLVEASLLDFKLAAHRVPSPMPATIVVLSTHNVCVL